MLASVEERLTCIEKSLGVDSNSEAKPVDLDVDSVRKSLEKKGLNRVMKMSLDRLRRLKQFTEQPSSQPLSARLCTIQCCEDLVRHRAKLLEDFEQRFKVVSNSDHLSAVDSHQSALIPIENDIEEALQLWKQHTVEFQEFKEEYSKIMTFLQSNLQDLEQKLSIAEQKAQLSSEE